MTSDPTVRDDRDLMQNLSPIAKILLGYSMYIPFSWFKKTVYKILGARIGTNVYFGPGSLLISGDFHNVTIGDGAFIAPGVMMHVDHLSVGAHTTIGYQSLLVGDHMSIGSGCNISNRAFIEASFAPVTLGDSVTLGACVIISSHDGSYRQTYGLEMKQEPITIRDLAFIGNGAIILPGIEIGERVIVGAGAVVTKSVEPGVVVAGVPARVIKKCADTVDHFETVGKNSNSCHNDVK